MRNKSNIRPILCLLLSSCLSVQLNIIYHNILGFLECCVKVRTLGLSEWFNHYWPTPSSAYISLKDIFGENIDQWTAVLMVELNFNPISLLNSVTRHPWRMEIVMTSYSNTNICFSIFNEEKKIYNERYSKIVEIYSWREENILLAHVLHSRW